MAFDQVLFLTPPPFALTFACIRLPTRQRTRMSAASVSRLPRPHSTPGDTRELAGRPARP